MPCKQWVRHVSSIRGAQKIAKAFKAKIKGVPKKVKLKSGKWGYKVTFVKAKKKKRKR